MKIFKTFKTQLGISFNDREYCGRLLRTPLVSQRTPWRMSGTTSDSSFWATPCSNVSTHFVEKFPNQPEGDLPRIAPLVNA